MAFAGFRPGTLVGGSDGKIYAVTSDGSSIGGGWTRGAKRHIASPVVFNCLGYNWSRVISAAASELVQHETGSQLSGCTHPNGSILKRTDDSKVWFINGAKRWIPSPTVRDSWGFYNDIVSNVSVNIELGSIPQGGNLGYRPGTLVQKPSDPAVFLISSSGGDFGRAEKRWIMSERALTCYGYSFSQVAAENASVVSDHPTGSDLTC